MFPHCSFVVSKHCAIICLNRCLQLEDAAISLDERCITASIQDSRLTICKVANVYIPAQLADRNAFLPMFMSLPFWSEMMDSQWFLLGDFNIHLHNPVEIRGSHIKPFVEWLNCHFYNCFPKGKMTLPRAGTTIDYIFGPSTLATRLINAETHYMPTQWTDHSLLTIDLITSNVNLGPGSWRFNPRLLENTAFQELLDRTVELFLASESLFSDSAGAGAGADIDNLLGSSDPPGVGLRTNQEHWESLKMLVKYCAQQFTRGQKARYQARISCLQRERAQLLGNKEESTRVKNLEKLIDERIQEDTRQAILRSATRWHEQGERNNKYFYRVIKDREAQ